MSTPYRGGAPAELRCPRCKKLPLPPLDVATCACGGVWVSAFAASEVLSPEELRADKVTRWWRVREPCPSCSEKMVLRGREPGLFQGCDLHGYWIDADTIAHTGLARGIDHAAIERKRGDTARVEHEREQLERLAVERATAKEHKELVEAGLVVTHPEESPLFDKLSRADLRISLTSAIGYFAADYLLTRLDTLEHRVAELEAAARPQPPAG